MKVKLTGSGMWICHSLLVSESTSVEKWAEEERRSCVCQSEVPLTVQPVAFRLPLLFPSPSHWHTTSLSPPEIIVYSDSQTLPLSRDPTLQIYSAFFYQPQNARRKGRQGPESLGFNLLPTPYPPPTPFLSLSLFVSWYSLPPLLHSVQVNTVLLD